MARIDTRNINPQHSPKRQFYKILRHHARLPDERTFTRDTKGIKHVERIVPQPSHEAGYASSLEIPHKIAITDHLGNGPGKQHRAIEGRWCRGLGIAIHHGPNEE